MKFFLITFMTMHWLLAAAPPELPESEYQIARQYLATVENRPVTKQCRGTCYAEAAYKFFEYRYAQTHGKPISIARADYWLKSIRNNFYIDYFLKSKDGRFLQKEKTKGKIDLVTAGLTHSFYQELYHNEAGVRVVPQFNQANLYREDKLVQRIFERIEEELAFLSSNVFPDLVTPENQMPTEDQFKIQILLAQLAEIAERQTDVSKNSFYITHNISSFNSLLEQIKFIKVSLQITLGAQEYTNSEFYKELNYLESVINTEKLKLKKKYNNARMANFDAIFQVFQESLKEIEAEFATELEELYKNSKIYHAEFSKKIPSFRNEEELAQHFRERKGPVPIGIEVLKGTELQDPDLHGLIYESFDRDQSPRGGHALMAIDMLFDEEDKPLYIVLDNTWGIARGHKGIFLLHKSLFDTVRDMYGDSRKTKSCLGSIEAFF